MKKWVVGAVVAVAAVALVGGGAAFAAYRASAPVEAPTAFWGPYGPMMGGYRGGEGLGPMHEYMMDAFAEALGLAHEDLEARLAEGETIASIAQAQGLTADQLRTLWEDARKSALAAAVADGVITQEQADWMLENMAWCGPFVGTRARGLREPFDFGPGGRMGPRRFRWSRFRP